jgi:hypothetical protein
LRGFSAVSNPARPKDQVTNELSNFGAIEKHSAISATRGWIGEHLMLVFLTEGERAAATACLDVEMEPSTTLMDHWNCKVQVVDPDPAVSWPPYLLNNIMPRELGDELEKWSASHGRSGPLPVYVRKATPQVIASIRYRG